MKAIGLCFLLLLVTLPAVAISLPLKGNAEVESSQVVLSDLLSVADASRLAKISGQITLFKAPAVGMKRKVSRQTIRRLVGRQIKSDQLQLSGADSVTIIRKGEWIEPVEVEKVLNDYLSSAESALGDGFQLSFKKIHLPPRFMVPVGKIEYQVIPAEPKVIGSRRMTLITRVDGQVVSNRSLLVVLKATAQIVVAVENLQRGDLISSSSIELQAQDVSDLEKPFFTIGQLLGKQLKQSVRRGQPLVRRQVDFPPLIKRGAQVTIQAKSKGLILKASGEARQDGELGETIRVRNNGSQKDILCRVEASGLVSVEF
ncbi:MAG: flagellar basal body P-ring formation chaperone FlgA [Geopsychrobacter sp.]|nr:flagellar basal body P-ring formation chaperone FlgA [Geopsychrobacter sp.]